MHSNIGGRIREERERIGLSQMAFGEIGGVKKLAQLKYEQGGRAPDALYLEAISRVGVDVQFVVTGVRSVAALTKDEEELISYYRSAPLAVKQAVFAALSVGNPPESGTTVKVTGGTGQRIAGRDFHENKK
ncbi:helix-turn-helix transcriptional regulator [Yersinia enterocolitica]|uniref:helix-turn-helix domain-containing protein n=1 Tax=Yersinia enterocolitica TaxID=630 RepID=UPI0005DD9C10|nr:helix-turn-helix transcriptional regulator [Yersinia enterocolitica]EKN3970540.1 helix-turn-helix transcriptional regulator [Yersinia enterocolitica]EKN4802694.1 helix-turn-helix transcriptional regulator [Yersinia enterocolitica]EKN4845875.1 helix-turn-helix transcriptional regulator [Yersinia enterocolitica]EKN5117698.1 XRE family transcriptional regulator [Yersinia enterocolitica]ELI8151723.1 helix-turn-helix transcriptional regulator [Yersinia enterocolitica]